MKIVLKEIQLEIEEKDEVIELVGYFRTNRIILFVINKNDLEEYLKMR